MYYDNVSRSAIVVRPKKPLLDWINAIYPSFPNVGCETTVYLVKENDDEEDIEKWPKKNAKSIFESELNNRHEGEEDWPKLRTWKVFNEWFDTSIHLYVMDTQSSFIKKY